MAMQSASDDTDSDTASSCSCSECRGSTDDADAAVAVLVTSKLSPDVMSIILHYLRLKNVRRVAQVCVEWRELVYASPLWHRLHNRWWGAAVRCSHPATFQVRDNAPLLVWSMLIAPHGGLRDSRGRGALLFLP